MNRLVQVVNEARQYKEQLLQSMVDEYRCKAAEVLTKYFRDPTNDDTANFVAVEVADIDYTDGIVTVGRLQNLYVETSDEPFRDTDFIPIKDFSPLGAVNVLTSNLSPAHVEPFIRQLEKNGFSTQYMCYLRKDPAYKGYGLCPFFRV